MNIGGSTQETSRNNLVPKKVEVFIRRALKGRLPVRVELDKRGIDLNTVLCPCCEESIESIAHCLVGCKDSLAVWEKVFNWWGVVMNGDMSVHSILNHDGNNCSSFPSIKLWQAALWTTGYLLWQQRNNRNKVSTVTDLFQETQVQSFNWVSRRLKKGYMSWNSWKNNPSRSLSVLRNGDTYI